ncbi:UDP-N-acetylglucosamine--undecaprenyl-phosphate N-acetylglucosaminephosphotransferase [Pseudoalteromonas distincta]|nr:UDP-N-acetylglucosamine--undecaprenyl-phosphate N-acetylglucosaminephosphotransferase [Pseudoalteromonas distincta]MDC3212134.1 UDP-N-acetylglucosamine--undecaprenyl-phosphate N-acetylglucosaminephosphotransferase [Pseudoalteromonas distincta]
MLIVIIFSLFFCSFLSLFLFRKFAIIINLVDKPNARKHHSGAVPLVGGLAIFVVVFSYLVVFPDTITSSFLYLVCASILLLVGVIDDLLDISFRLRLMLQIVISGLMMGFGGLFFQSAGYLLGNFELNLSIFSYVFTIITVVGAINAFNMVDGIDGLLGGLATVTFSSLGVLFYINGDNALVAFCAVIVISTIPYILMNLGFPLGQRFKVFMGDAGSTVIGFTVIWLLLEGSQSGTERSLNPVIALWLAAVPIMDAITTIIRRIKKKVSPFRPDREHLHHILQRLGLGPKMTLAVICFSASVFACIGIFAQVYNVPEYIMFYSFIACLLIYNHIMQNIWRFTVVIRRAVRRLKRNKKTN